MTSQSSKNHPIIRANTLIQSPCDPDSPVRRPSVIPSNRDRARKASIAVLFGLISTASLNFCEAEDSPTSGRSAVSASAPKSASERWNRLKTLYPKDTAARTQKPKSDAGGSSTVVEGPLEAREGSVSKQLESSSSTDSRPDPLQDVRDANGEGRGSPLSTDKAKIDQGQELPLDPASLKRLNTDPISPFDEEPAWVLPAPAKPIERVETASDRSRSDTKSVPVPKDGESGRSTSETSPFEPPVETIKQAFPSKGGTESRSSVVEEDVRSRDADETQDHIVPSPVPNDGQSKPHDFGFPRQAMLNQERVKRTTEVTRDRIAPTHVRRISGIVPVYDQQMDLEIRNEAARESKVFAEKLGARQFGADPYVERNFPAMSALWDAPNFYHYPLYFEDPALERYGHTHHPLIQPFASIGRFGVQLVSLPYQMTIDPPCREVYTLGWYRPGECAPKLHYQIPLNAQAAAVEAATVTGLFFLIP